MAERILGNEKFPNIVLGAAFVETQHTLEKRFGTDTTRILGYRLTPEPRFSERTLHNFARGNYIARDLLAQGLPLVSLFNAQDTSYFLESTKSGDWYHLSSDKLGPVINFTDRIEDREIASLAAIQVFRYITKAYLGSIPQELIITKDSRVIEHYSNQLFAALKAMAANSEKEKELNNYFENLQDQLSCRNDVSIVGRGLQMEMQLDGLTMLYLLRSHHMAVIDILTESELPIFIRNMENKHTWFRNPTRWENIPAERPIKDDFRRALEETKGFLEALGLANNQALILERFRTSTLAAQIGINFIEESMQSEIETEFKNFQDELLSENQTETEHRELPVSLLTGDKKKKEKKKKSPPPPIQVFPKKAREQKVRTPQTPPPTAEVKTAEVKINIPIKSEPPPDFVFETDEARRLREKAEEKAERKRRRAEQYAAFLARQARREREAQIIQRRNAATPPVEQQKPELEPTNGATAPPASSETRQLSRDTHELLQRFTHVLTDEDENTDVSQDLLDETLEVDETETFQKIKKQAGNRRED